MTPEPPSTVLDFGSGTSDDHRDDFGSGTSDDHRDGIRWVDYRNISWNPVFCKRCDICVEICPKNTLVLRNDAIIEEENCILCGLCERYCPDLAIEMIPEAVEAHAAKGKEGPGG